MASLTCCQIHPHASILSPLLPIARHKPLQRDGSTSYNRAGSKEKSHWRHLHCQSLRRSQLVWLSPVHHNEAVTESFARRSSICSVQSGQNDQQSLSDDDTASSISKFLNRVGQNAALGFIGIAAVSAATLLSPFEALSADGGGPFPCQNTKEYYAGLQDLKGSRLKSELHKLISGHKVYTYAQVWDALKVLDAADEQNPASSPDVNDIYSSRRIAKSLAGDPEGWNREHLWPRSFGLAGNLPEFSDLHNLRPADENVNSARGNKYFGECTPDSGRCLQPANREAGEDTATNVNIWTPPGKVRGDIARVMLYMAVRYEGEQPGSKDLELSNSPDVAAGRMGLLSTLLKWHAQDPPSPSEALRNDRVCSLYQHNRNPFVDHPEYVPLIWTSAGGIDSGPTTPSAGGIDSGPTTPQPNPPPGTGGEGQRPPVPVEGVGVTDPSIPAWINEIHYDNKGVDVNEFVEVAVGPGVDPDSLRIVFYNGSNGQAYKTLRLLSGDPQPPPPPAGAGIGPAPTFRFLSANADGLQNGPQDGIALVALLGGKSPSGESNARVVQFLSYEGTLIAQDGPAKGMTSVDINVQEADSTPEGSSLGLTGKGSKYSDFRWAVFPRTATPGSANASEIVVVPTPSR